MAMLRRMLAQMAHRRPWAIQDGVKSGACGRYLRRFTLIGLVAPLACLATTAEEAALIRQSAERGNHGAQVLLGLIYRHGDAGYPRDANQSAYWMLRAARQGNAYAQAVMGDYCEQGIGVAKDPALAAHWRELAAAQGNAEAQFKLGRMYREGNGVARDYARAERWLGQAADQGNADAQYLLGKMYHEGHGVPQDLERGKRWLGRAAAQGHDDALKLLNAIAELGRNLLDAYQGGDDLMEKARAGNPEAQYELGLRYETGAWGVEQDNKAAVYWLTRAAEGGHRLAMQTLAHIHEKGLLGVSADAAAARAWSE